MKATTLAEATLGTAALNSNCDIVSSLELVKVAVIRKTPGHLTGSKLKTVLTPDWLKASKSANDCLT